MDWPSAQGKAINIGAYDNSVRFMTMYPEKREALLK
jgi:hypothetical protein